jgi:hypothetical protein
LDKAGRYEMIIIIARDSIFLMRQVAFEPGVTLMAKKETNAFAVLKHRTLQHIV